MIERPVRKSVRSWHPACADMLQLPKAGDQFQRPRLVFPGPAGLISPEPVTRRRPSHLEASILGKEETFLLRRLPTPASDNSDRKNPCNLRRAIRLGPADQ